MKIYINTDVEHYGLPRFIVKYIDRLGLREMNDDNPEIVFNIDSIDTKGFKKGKKCTLYLTGDEYLQKVNQTQRYADSDILYTVQKSYLKYYPSKAKVLSMGIDPELHYPRNVKKEYDYVFVGKTRGNEVYDHRNNILEELKRSKYKMLITEGDMESYCDLMSSGRIILNIMPRKGLDVCTNFRILEGMAMGCVMTDYHKDLDDWGIIPNIHYLTLDRFGDISDEEISCIHEAGRKYVLEHFSYIDTVNRIVKDIENYER